MKRFDAIVIGAGVNGLVAARVLARKGRRVLVVERQKQDDGRLDTGWIPTGVVRMAGEALRVVHADPWLVAALPDGGQLELWHDVHRTAEAIRRLSVRDAAAWPAFAARMTAVARFLEALYAIPTPDIATRDLGEMLRLARLGWKAKRMGRESMTDLLRILPMSVADLLDEWFESDALKGALGAGAVRHLRQGPRSGGTAFTLLHGHVGCALGVFRHPQANLREALEALPGITCRRAADVQRIGVVDGQVTGVVLADGEEIAAPIVVSNADPRRTMLDLVSADWLAPEFLDAVRHIRYRGAAARVTLTLDRPLASPLAVAPSLTYLERAYDAAKYGQVSDAPYVELMIRNGAADAHVQYAPHTLRDGEWDDARRAVLGEQVVSALAAHGVADAVVRKVLTPVDLERRYGVTEGHLLHGDHTLDQVLFMRPVPGWSRHRTPVMGLYLTGPGTHPGGGILGGAGLLTARAILEDARR